MEANDGNHHGEAEPTFRAALHDALAAWSLSADEHQINAMASHYLYMVDVNRTMNLTRITEPRAAAMRHFADSLSVMAWLGQDVTRIRRALDVGTGAGFPAIPLAVMNPTWQIHAIDSTRKKIDFVRATCQKAGVSNVTPVHARSEEWKPTTEFDLVFVRAVSSVERCIQWTGHHLAPGGRLVCFVTANQPPPDGTTLKKQLLEHGLRELTRFDYELGDVDDPVPRTLRIFQRDA